jgi:UDP:flavonoid glycosyltransferase YjiC (YdhE family)
MLMGVTNRLGVLGVPLIMVPDTHEQWIQVADLG